MPEVGSQVLEVTLGLLFVYLVFSLVCSTLQETLATALSWRAEGLEQGLRGMLQGKGQGKDDAAHRLFDELVDHPRIKSMLPPKRILRTEKKVPSYLSSRTFSLTLLDTVAPPKQAGASRDLVTWAREEVGEFEDEGLKRELIAMLDAAEGDLTKLRTEIEHWYDDTMNRVSGWYKRRTQVWLLLFGVLVASVANIDTFQVVDRLWKDPTTRAAVVAQAEKVASADSTDELEKVAGEYDAIKGLELPVGWTTPTNDDVAKEDPRAFPQGINAMKVLGILLTALALSFGAPFWFDALSKVSRLRATGKPEGRAPGTANP